ncbi:MAG: nucleotidyltransferase family protein [Bacteroidota bacterium]
MSRKEIENIILDYLKAFGIKRLGIFGSFARNEQNSDSDIDLLVKFKVTPSLLQLIKIENDLSKKLGFKVDLITEGSIKNKRIKTQIKKDIKVIYSA